jgi:hypothetical protein
MFITLAGVESEPSCGSAFRMSWWPASSSSIRRKGCSPALRRRQTSATSCRPDRKRHQPLSFQLLGLDGLVVTPIGGRGPLRHGARAEVVAAAGEPLVQRWSPPLASRLGGFREDSGHKLLARPCWRRVVYTCRDGARAPLEGRCNNFCFYKAPFEHYLSSSSSTYLCTTCPCCVWCCRLLPGTWPPWDVSSTC